MESNTTQQYNNAGVVSVECIGLVLTILLNLIHLHILSRTPCLFTENLRMCLRLLSFVDILGGLASYGVKILFFMQGDLLALFSSNVVTCNVVTGTTLLFVLSSQMLLFVVTIDRYVAVTRPLRYQAILTRRCVQGLLLMAILAGLTLSLVQSAHSVHLDICYYVGNTYASGAEQSSARVIAGYGLVPCALVIVVTVLNAHLLWIARNQQKRDDLIRRQTLALQSRTSRSNHPYPKQAFSKEYKSAITLCAVVAASYLVWTPYLIAMVTFVSSGTESGYPPAVRFFIYWLVFITFWLNPIILGGVSSKYRRSLAAALCHSRSDAASHRGEAYS